MAEEIGNEPLTNATDAYDFVKMVDAPVPELEPLIASVPDLAYLCDMYFVGSFPAGERAIAGNPSNSLNYAGGLGTRIRYAEDTLAENDTFAAKYGTIMTKHELWDSWTKEEIARSTVWMYQYAKDYMKGPLPDELRSLMYLKSVVEPDNMWIKNTSKQRSIELGAVNRTRRRRRSSSYGWIRGNPRYGWPLKRYGSVGRQRRGAWGTVKIIPHPASSLSKPSDHDAPIDLWPMKSAHPTCRIF